jgi:hypothetical protein
MPFGSLGAVMGSLVMFRQGSPYRLLEPGNVGENRVR